MSKLFYSVEETAQKLGKSEDEVRQMASSGALEEFREGDELVFKAEQVDLLSGGDEDEDLSLDLDGGLDLADSAGASGISLSDSEIDLGESALDLSGAGDAAQSAIPIDEDAADLSDASSASGGGGSVFDLAESDLDLTLADSAAAGDGVDLGSDPDDGESPMEQTGVSIFADDGEEADPSAATFVADGAGAPEIDLGADQLDSVGSGSGLLDLTQEGDDTSLGVDLLDDAYGGGDATSMGAPSQPEEGAGLFESTEAVGGGELGGMPAMAMPVAAYDGSGSGLVLGLSIGVTFAALFAGAATILSSSGVGVSMIIDAIGGQWWIPAAALGGITLFGAVIGLFMMKKG